MNLIVIFVRNAKVNNQTLEVYINATGQLVISDSSYSERISESSIEFGGDSELSASPGNPRLVMYTRTASAVFRDQFASHPETSLDIRFSNPGPSEDDTIVS